MNGPSTPEDAEPSRAALGLADKVAMDEPPAIRSRNLSAASASHRAALTRLGERAEATLREASLGATHHVLLRIETTLTTAADPALREALRQRRVEREMGPPQRTPAPDPGGPVQGGRGWP